jgi:hypothetical protein
MMFPYFKFLCHCLVEQLFESDSDSDSEKRIKIKIKFTSLVRGIDLTSI